MSEKAVLSWEGRQTDLPLLHGRDGSTAVDVTSLYRETKVVVYDPGLMSTAVCKSAITFIDGDKGVLRYRGYDIDGLAAMQGGFLRSVYLLLYGVLPNEEELRTFSATVAREYSVPQSVIDLIRSFPRDAHPMAILIACFAALSAHYHGNEPPSLLDGAVLAVSKVAGVVASIYRHIANLEPVAADTNLGYSENFIHMMFGNSVGSRSDVMCRVMDVIFTLHADHEQNASTAAVRISCSAGAGLFACLVAGAATLWGSAHGGANEAVINMLDEIGSPENVSSFIQKVKSNSDAVRLMGFGHRVYKSYDPRARIIKDACREVLDTLGSNDALLDVAIALEAAALDDEYFIKRKLYPNVDFYSGIILKAMGVPVSMFTTFFALARTAGWAAQWCEMKGDKEGSRIWRPRQLYMGKV